MSGHGLIALVQVDAGARRRHVAVLQRAGYEVVPFVSGASFLASLSTEVPDCVVLDVQRQDVSGLDVQLRLQVAGVHVPAVFVTGSDEASLGASVLATGGTQPLREPFTDETLLDAVAAALQSGRVSKPLALGCFRELIK